MYLLRRRRFWTERIGNQGPPPPPTTHTELVHIAVFAELLPSSGHSVYTQLRRPFVKIATICNIAILCSSNVSIPHCNNAPT